MTVEEQLAHHLFDADFCDLPEEAVDAARREVLWVLGTSVAGGSAEGSEQVIAYARQFGAPEEATVIGFGDRLPASIAGFANGCLAKALEYEDKLWLDRSHGHCIGPSVVPAAFAVAELIGGVDGRSFLAAVALATDLHARMLRVVPNPTETGWNPAYLYANFGAALVAAKLVRLEPDQLLNALGLAYAQTTANRQSLVESVLGNRLQMGFGVRNGITAAQLARLGVTGAKHCLTGKYGLYPLFFKDCDVNLAGLTEELGHRFEGTMLGFKAHPCGAVAHPVLDAAQSLSANRGPAPESIESVHVHGTTLLRWMADPLEMRQNPRSVVEASFSLPWVVACTLVDGRLSLSHLTERALQDRRYVELARKVHVHMVDARREGVRVELRLRDGRTVCSEVVTTPKGHPENPMSTEEMVERYRECVQAGPKPLARERTELAKDLVLRLQEIADAARVIRLLA